MILTPTVSEIELNRSGSPPKSSSPANLSAALPSVAIVHYDAITTNGN